MADETPCNDLDSALKYENYAENEVKFFNVVVALIPNGFVSVRVVDKGKQHRVSDDYNRDDRVEVLPQNDINHCFSHAE